MRHLQNLEVGVATHTGRVRRTNEDDFLVCAPQSHEENERRGWVAVIADGMGGAAGGAEASRTAVRAAIRPFLAANGTTAPDPTERMRLGFAAAVEEVLELSLDNPNLRGTGTTLTIANLLGDSMVIGHVGDTRCLRLRDGELEQLTVDHATREPESYLTRCIGADQREVDVDISEIALRAGDRVVLMTDGLWGVVAEETIRDVVATHHAQRAAEDLVRLANRNGGPDNSTVIVLHVLATDAAAADASCVESELPTEEIPQPAMELPVARPLVPSRWPWVLFALSLLLLAAGIAKAWFGFDVLQWLGWRTV